MGDRWRQARHSDQTAPQSTRPVADVGRAASTLLTAAAANPHGATTHGSALWRPFSRGAWGEEADAQRPLGGSVGRCCTDAGHSQQRPPGRRPTMGARCGSRSSLTWAPRPTAGTSSRQPHSSHEWHPSLIVVFFWQHGSRRSDTTEFGPLHAFGALAAACQ
jgi:hypothetical protein